MALLTVVCALLTLFTTGMIYASLRDHPAMAPAADRADLHRASASPAAPCCSTCCWRCSGWLAALRLGWPSCRLIVAAALKWLYWLAIDGEVREHTIEAATGLGHLGKVRALEPPHTQPNFIMREMGYRVARKHAQRLRKLALLLAVAGPIAMLLLSQAPRFAILGSLLATLSMTIGLLIERWLFFAEAEHVSMLYYGTDVA